MYAARMPWARHSQVVPPSRVIHTPPHETPTVTWRASRGSTQIEWRPGSSAPPPNHSRRLGWRHSDSTSCHDDPRSRERNSPPGSVPHHSVPGSVSWPASNAHTSSVLHGMGLPELGSRSSIPSGLGGYAGFAVARDGITQVRPVADLSTVDEHDHVTPHGALIVEHVVARPGVRGEHPLQDLAHGTAVRLGRGAGDVSLDVLGERHVRHDVDGMRAARAAPGDS